MTGWPEAVARTPAAGVIDRALARGRLGHALLFHGDAGEVLEAAAVSLAERLLAGASGAAPFPPLRHPDCFILRPEGKSRQIAAEPTRGLIGNVQRSPQAGERKVALLLEAERMNPAAANIFLKTLEEPPLNTTIILVTTHPYALLPTIRSRCLHFRFPARAEASLPEGWASWAADYVAWLDALIGGVTAADRRAVASQVFTLYGLIARLEAMLDDAAGTQAKRRLDELAARQAELTDEQRDAIEAGASVGVRQDLLAAIAHATREFAAGRARAGRADDGLRPALVIALRRLERCAGLLRANLGTTAALEEFFLASLRAWSRAAAPAR